MTLKVFTDPGNDPGEWVDWPDQDHYDQEKHPGKCVRLKLRHLTPDEEAGLRRKHLKGANRRRGGGLEAGYNYQVARCATALMDTDGLKVELGDDGARKLFRHEAEELVLDGNWTPHRKDVTLRAFTALSDHIAGWLQAGDQAEAAEEMDLAGN